MAAVNCIRTISTNSIPAGQTFQITYGFENTDSVAHTITSFVDNSWINGSAVLTLEVPSGGLMPIAAGWLTAPTSGNSFPDKFFQFSNQPVIAANSTASIQINVEGIDPPGGLVSGTDFNFAHVTFTVQNFGNVGLNSDNDVTITAMICVAEGTLLALADGRQLPIEQLRPGHMLINHAGRPVRLSAAIRIDHPTTSLIQLEQGSLGRDVPSAPLRIRPGHPLLVAGKEVLPENLLQQPGVAQVQLEKPVHVYTLLTEQRSFVNMQGALVGTWSEAAWQNFVDNDERSAHLQWSIME